MRIATFMRTSGMLGAAFALLAPLSTAQNGAPPMGTQHQFTEGSGQGTITLPTLGQDGLLVAMLMDEGTGQMHALDALLTSFIPGHLDPNQRPFFGGIYGKLVDIEQGVIAGSRATAFVQGQWMMREGHEGTLEAIVLSPADTEGTHPIGRIEGKFVITDPARGTGVVSPLDTPAGKKRQAGDVGSPVDQLDQSVDAIAPLNPFGSAGDFDTPENASHDGAGLEQSVDAIGPWNPFGSTADFGAPEDTSHDGAGLEQSIDAIGPWNPFGSTGDFGAPENPPLDGAAAMDTIGLVDDPVPTGFVGLHYVLVQ